MICGHRVINQTVNLRLFMLKSPLSIQVMAKSLCHCFPSDVPITSMLHAVFKNIITPYQLSR